jgi:flagellin
MGLRLTQDVSATHAYRNLSVTQDQVSRSMERLSSRLGIDPSSHDAARPDLAHQV